MNTKLWNNLYKGSERYGKAVEMFKTELPDPLEGYDALSKMIEKFSEEYDTWESISGGIIQIEAERNGKRHDGLFFRNVIFTAPDL